MVAAGFEPVRDEFERNFAERGEVGAACCVYRGGEPVVDLWGGTTEAGGDVRYTDRTLQMVASATKGALAITAFRLAERGELDLDAPVARYWPEFAAAGKEGLPVRWLLSHQAGLPAIHRHALDRGDRGMDRAGRRARRRDPGLGAGHRPRLPRHHLRLAGGRGHQPRDRDDLRPGVRRGGGAPARPRPPHRAGAGRASPGRAADPARRRRHARRADPAPARPGLARPLGLPHPVRPVRRHERPGDLGGGASRGQRHGDGPCVGAPVRRGHRHRRRRAPARAGHGGAAPPRNSAAGSIA